jgi:diguanylate cyclase (GGDEF)-like protein
VSEEIPRTRILIVEDDDDQRQLICEALGVYYGDSDCCNIVGVATAAECLEMRLESFDVVLQDFHLPDMPGLALLEKILSRADLPVIMVTGDNNCTVAAEAIRRGALDYVVKLGDYLFSIPVVVDKNIRLHRMKKENERLQRELQAMLAELQDKNVQLQDSLEKLRKMATTDHLTGLANRRHFAEVLGRCFNEASRYGFDLTCCMCDMDGYKDINDTLGHQVGDRILEIAADVIRSSLRGSDMAARYGGDEFVLLLPHTSVDSALAVAERIRQQLVLESGRSNDRRQCVSLSIGIASLAADKPMTSEALLAMADRALYAAKANPGGGIVVFGDVLRTASSLPVTVVDSVPMVVPVSGDQPQSASVGADR